MYILSNQALSIIRMGVGEAKTVLFKAIVEVLRR